MEQGICVAQDDGSAPEVRWAVDLAAAGRVAAWARRAPALLEQEVREMAAYFPHWVLTAGDGTQLNPCAACGDLLVLRSGKLRCVRCGRAGHGGALAWTGHLPIPVGGLPRARARITRHPHPGFPLLEIGPAPLWLVPVVAFYPADWPHTAPTLRYDPALFRILGIRRPGAAQHIIGDTTMCLYAWGQWREVSLRVVLQQRVVNHLASLLKVAEGQAPAQAFAGRQHGE